MTLFYTLTQKMLLWPLPLLIASTVLVQAILISLVLWPLSYLMGPDMFIGEMGNTRINLRIRLIWYTKMASLLHRLQQLLLTLPIPVIRARLLTWLVQKEISAWIQIIILSGLI